MTILISTYTSSPEKRFGDRIASLHQDLNQMKARVTSMETKVSSNFIEFDYRVIFKCDCIVTVLNCKYISYRVKVYVCSNLD